MKPSSAPPKSKRVSARNAALLNLAAWPGLGTLFAGRRLTGTAQMLVFVFGFILFCAGSFRNIYDYYQFLSFETAVVQPGAGKNPVAVGLCICAVAWVWSLITSISLSRAAANARVDQTNIFSAATQKMDEAEIVSALATLPGWTRQGEIISRSFEFKDFPTAIKFVNAVAELAEEAQHHPDLDVRWNRVTLALTTHDAGGLTEKDFALARACEGLAKF